MNGARNWLLIAAAALALAACGGGGGGGTGDDATVDDSAEQAAALVDEGKTLLIDILQSDLQNNPIPFSAVSDAGDLFVQAAELDPSNPDAAFFGGAFQLIHFLDSQKTTQIITALGWAPLDDACGTEELMEVVSVALNGLPKDGQGNPETEFTTPCGSLPYQEGDFGILAGPGDDDGYVAIGGEPGAANLTLGQLLQYFTRDLPDALGKAVALLEQVPPDFQTTLVFVPYSDGGGGQRGAGEPITIELDYADAKLAQAALATVRAALVAPTIWKYPGVDAFIESHRDFDGEEYTVNIASADLETYFQSGQPGYAGLPLAANPTGKGNLKGSLSSALKGVEDSLTGLSEETDDQSDDLLQRDMIFDLLTTTPGDYADKDAVVKYFLKPIIAMAGDVRDSIQNGSSHIPVYQTAAFITDWTPCDPGDGNLDTDPHNDATSDSLPATVDDIVGTVVVATVDGGAVQPDDPSVSVNTFSVNVAAPANLSIYTTGGNDTQITVGYDNGGSLVAWDHDDDSGDGGNAGVSIDKDYFDDSLLPIPGGPGLTLYIQVTENTGSGYDLVVESDDDAASAGVPIFLKGGGGRNFEARVYSYASIDFSVGGLIDVMTTAFDKSRRNTFSIVNIVDDPQTPDVNEEGTELHLTYGNSTLRTELRKIFPWLTDADLAESSIDPNNGMTDTDLAAFQLPALDPFGVEPEGPVDMSAGFGGTLPFCAYPKDLSGSMGFAGGYSVVNLFGTSQSK